MTEIGSKHFFTFFRTLEYTERAFARVLEFSFSLLGFGDFVTDLSVGARSAAAALLCLFQVLAENRGVKDGS